MCMLWRNISWIERTIGHEQRETQKKTTRKKRTIKGRRGRRLLRVTIAPLARSPLNRGRFRLVICRFVPLKRQGGVLQFGKLAGAFLHGIRLGRRHGPRTASSSQEIDSLGRDGKQRGRRRFQPPTAVAACSVAIRATWEFWLNNAPEKNERGDNEDRGCR